MKPMLMISAAVFLTGSSAAFNIYEGTVQTVCPDPSYPDMSEHEHREQLERYEPFRARVILGTDTAPEMVILLEEGLSDSLGLPLLQQWIDDIESEEYTAMLVEVSYGTPEEIKVYLDSLYTAGLKGAALVGNLPAAWVKVYDTQVQMGETLPCDYYFMDLDGEWLDLWTGFPRDSIPGADGYYDTFQGSLQPEIWVGRIKVDNLYDLGDPVEMLQAYLERNHEWRENGDPEPVKALCYVDDDWAVSGPSYQSFMELLYENVELVNQSDLTTSEDYEENRLPDTYSWVSPFVHSYPIRHLWYPAAGSTWWDEIVPIAPPARFYNLFACSNCRFTTPRYMGGVYAFCTDAGLAAVGSTTSGAMLMFGNFYGPLGGRGSLGEAWMNWWDRIAIAGFSPHELNWHIGMVLLGDPSLVPAKHLTGIREADPVPEELHMTISPNPAAGSQVTVSLTLPTEGEAVLDVYNLSGRRVQQIPFNEGAGSLQVILNDLSSGVYLIRLETASSTAESRLIVLEGR